VFAEAHELDDVGVVNAPAQRESKKESIVSRYVKKGRKK